MSAHRRPALVLVLCLGMGLAACSTDEPTEAASSPSDGASQSASESESLAPPSERAASAECQGLIDVSVEALRDGYAAAADFDADEVTQALQTGEYPGSLAGPFTLLISTETQLVAAACPPSAVVAAQAAALEAEADPTSGGQEVLRGMLAQVAEQMGQ